MIITPIWAGQTTQFARLDVACGELVDNEAVIFTHTSWIKTDTTKNANTTNSPVYHLSGIFIHSFSDTLQNQRNHNSIHTDKILNLDSALRSSRSKTFVLRHFCLKPTYHHEAKFGRLRLKILGVTLHRASSLELFVLFKCRARRVHNPLNITVSE